MKYSLVFLCAGVGNRMKQPVPKQYLLLSGKQIFLHSLEKIEQVKDISEVIIVGSREYFDTIRILLDNRKYSKKVIFVEGGQTRQESVYNGLKRVSHSGVIIHEAARPFVTTDDFDRLIRDQHDNVTYAIRIPFTVTSSEGYTIATVFNRDELLNIQLPQKFNTKLLIEAHKYYFENNVSFTDDSSLFTSYKEKSVEFIEGSEYNVKITTQLDLLLAEQIYNSIFLSREIL